MSFANARHQISYRSPQQQIIIETNDQTCRVNQTTAGVKEYLVQVNNQDLTDNIQSLVKKKH